MAMTTETMREAVARAMIAAKYGLDNNGAESFWAGMLKYQDGLASEYEQNTSDVGVARRQADAAIRTVLERLREPTSAMLAAATPGNELVAKGYWKDMLDAAAREVLPESADSGRG